MLQSGAEQASKLLVSTGDQEVEFNRGWNRNMFPLSPTPEVVVTFGSPRVGAEDAMWPSIFCGFLSRRFIPKTSPVQKADLLT